jgi:hypothetical protein
MPMAEVGVPEPLSTTYWSVLKKTAPNPLAPTHEEALAQDAQCARRSPAQAGSPPLSCPRCRSSRHRGRCNDIGECVIGGNTEQPSPAGSLARDRTDLR